MTGLYFTAHFESAAQRYYSQVLPLFKPKLEPKKLSEEVVGQMKEYRVKAQEVYRESDVKGAARGGVFYEMLVRKQA